MVVQHRILGQGMLEVSALGLGCMGMSQSYGVADEAESIDTIHRALELGITMLDTADVYGDGHNEELIGRAVGGRRDEVILATKFGMVRGPGGLRIDGRPEHVRKCIDASLERLGTDHVDLYYLHRIDPAVPVEETVGAMADLVHAGKVRHLGLSEASARSVERASAVHPIAALQSEWSLWTRDVEADVLATARRLGVAIVPFAPLGRGFLTGALTTATEFTQDDWRRNNPRFQGENFERNLRLVEELRCLAEARGCSPAQLALAWVLAQGEDVVPIPGTKRRAYLEENVMAADLVLTPEDRARLSAVAVPGAAVGDRYAQPGYSYGESPPTRP